MDAKRISKTTKHLIEMLRLTADPEQGYHESYIAGFRSAVTAALMHDGWFFDDARAYIDQQLAA